MSYWTERFSYLCKRGLVFSTFTSHLRHAVTRKYPKLLPSVPIDEIAHDDDVSVIPGSYRNGNVSEFELRVICRLVRSCQPKVLFEIGTFDGKTTLHLAANSPSDAKIFTLDLPQSDMANTDLRILSGERIFIDKDNSGSVFAGSLFESHITQLFGDSAKFEFTPFVDQVDFVFIDGSHSYEYVVNDTLIALTLLRGGKGVVLWHDYGWSEVIKALNEFYLNRPEFLEMKLIEGTTLAYLRVE